MFDWKTKNECSIVAIFRDFSTKQVRIYATRPVLLLSIKRGGELLARKTFSWQRA